MIADTTKATSRKTIESLRSDLFTARETIFNMLDEDYRRIFADGPSSTKAEDVGAWKMSCIFQILELVDSKPAREMDVFHSETVRAYCPLCKGSARSTYGQAKGFALPDGLMKHLNDGHCLVMCEILARAKRAAQRRAKRSVS